ncbi:MAG TPA: sigma-70 family RNA polymerase sigma factor [Anaerolineae bacterium]|nr:sigma-70 family RNA polymerase sigma factor [Anaerolineae bacterium]HPL29271.1 sigma-70 family RNA polymerase sigma factor [Anaerolineae bacterium]
MQEPSALLLARCCQGDAQAFAQLVASVQTYVYNLAYRLLRDEDEAHDLTQDALVRTWHMLPSFRGESRFTTWLYRLVVNLGLNHLARLRRRPQEAPLEGHVAADPSHLAADPQEIYEAAERRRIVWEAVDALPDKYRIVITLYYQHGCSYQEIADSLQLPLNTVKTHLARARRLLASRLAHLEGVADDL